MYLHFDKVNEQIHKNVLRVLLLFNKTVLSRSVTSVYSTQLIFFLFNIALFSSLGLILALHCVVEFGLCSSLASVEYTRFVRMFGYKVTTVLASVILVLSREHTSS